jgi:hypothetical protein
LLHLISAVWDIRGNTGGRIRSSLPITLHAYIPELIGGETWVGADREAGDVTGHGAYELLTLSVIWMRPRCSPQ